MSKTKKELMKEYAVEFARKGGIARAEKLTRSQRVEIAKKAANMRWKGKPMAKIS